MIFDYDADSFYTIVIHEYRDWLVARGKLPIGLPLLEPPAWRAQWVESAAGSR
jgi:hypothetical protein